MVSVGPGTYRNGMAPETNTGVPVCDFCDRVLAGGEGRAFGCEPFSTWVMPTVRGAVMRTCLSYTEQVYVVFADQAGREITPDEASSPAGDPRRMVRSEMTGDWLACGRCAPFVAARAWDAVAARHGGAGLERASISSLWLAFARFATGRSRPRPAVSPRPAMPARAGVQDGRDGLRIVCVSLADGRTDGVPVGCYLAHYDPEANDGHGGAVWTDDPAEAMMFATSEALVACVHAQPRCRPLRADGLPNRPLTMFTLDFLPASRSTAVT